MFDSRHRTPSLHLLLTANLLAVILVSAVTWAYWPAALAQTGPPVPTAPSGQPQFAPRPETREPSSDPSLPTPTPTPVTASPIGPAELRPEGPPFEGRQPAADGLQTDTYRIRGTVSLTTQIADDPPRVTRRAFEVTAGKPDGSFGEDRVLRLSTISATGDADDETVVPISAPGSHAPGEHKVYEIENAAVTVSSRDGWSIVPRSDPTRLALSLLPVLDLATLSYDLCVEGDTDGNTESRTDLDQADEACLLTDSDELEDFLARDDRGLNVQSSELVARLDLDQEVTLRYMLTANASDSDRDGQPITYRLEWSYESLPPPQLLEETLAWPTSVPHMHELAAPGFEAGALPAQDRMLSVSAADGVVHIQFDLAEAETRMAFEKPLREAGWDVRELGPGLLASRDSEKIAVLVSGNEGANISRVDLVQVR